MAAGPPVPIIRMSCSITGHFHSPFFCLCVVTTAGKDDVVFPPPITFFRFRGGGQDGDVSSTGDDGDGGPLLREFSRILHLFARSGFGVSLFKGENIMKRPDNQPACLSSTDI